MGKGSGGGKSASGRKEREVKEGRGGELRSNMGMKGRDQGGQVMGDMSGRWEQVLG